MKILKTLSTNIFFIFEILKDLLVPENKKIQKILKIDKSSLRLLLPASKVRSDSIFVLFDYKNETVRFLVKAIKYKNNQNVRRLFAEYLHEDMVEIFSDISLFEGSPPLLVPTPMSKNEKNKRGFNQCEEICKEVRRISDNSIKVSFDALMKVRETQRQATLSKEMRLLNVKDSMQTKPELVKGKVVAVLDDVYTTGATMEEARRALYAGGAKKVICFFLAH